MQLILLLFCFGVVVKNQELILPRLQILVPPSIKLNGHSVNSSNYNTGILPVIEFSFSSALDKSTVNSAFSFTNKNGMAVAYTVSYSNDDKTSYH